MLKNRIVQIPFAYDYFYHKLIKNAIPIDASDDTPKTYEGIDLDSFPKITSIVIPVHHARSCDFSRNLDNPDKRVIRRKVQEQKDFMLKYQLNPLLGITWKSLNQIFCNEDCPLYFFRAGKINEENY